MQQTQPIIGMILDSDFPPDPRVENEARVLINAGMEVNLFAFSYDKDFVPFETYKGIKVHRFYCSRLLYKLSALAYSVPLYHLLLKNKISKFISTTECHAVHIHDIQVARAIFMLRPKFKFKVMLDLHENRPEIMRFYKHVRSFPWKYFIYPSLWKRKEEQYVKQSDGVVVVTDQSKADIVKRTKIDENRVVVAPNVVEENYADEQRIDQGIVDKYSDDFVLLYLGDTSERRGVQTAISAMVELRKEIANIKLVVVGSSSYDGQLAQMIKRLQLADSVDLCGWQDSGLFPSYIQASDICISPLQRNKHHDTTYANKLFQYMALGGVLLVSDSEAQADLVHSTGTGLVFKDGIVEDFVDKTLDIYKNDAARKKYSENGISAVSEKYHWEKTGQDLVNYYRNLFIC